MLGVSPETYRRLEVEVKVAEDRTFRISESGYDKALREAARISSQEAEGTHGLRWSWAQERFQEVQEHAQTYEQALATVSQKMGHKRSDITEHYLR